MRTIIKTSLAFFFIVAITTSCTKESMETAATQQSANQSASQTANDAALVTHSIGEKFGGGIIFYLDATKQHGMVVTASDLSVSGNTQIQWYNGTFKLIGTTSTDIGRGLQNTNNIVNAQGNGTYAAKLCKDLVLNGFSDWYLPSKAELNQLFKHKGKVPGLSATNYWSSTEHSKRTAWDQEFGGGFQFTDEKSFTLRVRAVRSF